MPYFKGTESQMSSLLLTNRKPKNCPSLNAHQSYTHYVYLYTTGQKMALTQNCKTINLLVTCMLRLSVLTSLVTFCTA